MEQDTTFCNAEVGKFTLVSHGPTHLLSRRKHFGRRCSESPQLFGKSEFVNTGFHITEGESNWRLTSRSRNFSGVRFDSQDRGSVGSIAEMYGWPLFELLLLEWPLLALPSLVRPLLPSFVYPPASRLC